MNQIYPASITGKGSRFATGGSVLDHTFGKSDAYTLGAEEEYMLLDAETFTLSSTSTRCWRLYPGMSSSRASTPS